MNEPNDFADVERALGSLLPEPMPIDAKRLVWEAGHAAGGRSTRLWRATTGLMAALLAASVLTPMTMNRTDRVAGAKASRPEPVEGLRAPATSTSVTPGLAESQPSAFVYLEFRRRVLDNGLDALPDGPSGGATSGPMSPRDLERTLEHAL